MTKYTQEDIDDILGGLKNSLTELATNLTAKIQEKDPTLYVKLIEERTQFFKDEVKDLLKFDESNELIDVNKLQENGKGFSELNKINQELSSSALLNDSPMYNKKVAYKLVLASNDRKDLLNNDYVYLTLSQDFQAYIVDDGLILSKSSINKFYKNLNNLFYNIGVVGNKVFASQIDLATSKNLEMLKDAAKLQINSDDASFKEVASFVRTFVKKYAETHTSNINISDYMFDAIQEFAMDRWILDSSSKFDFLNHKDLVQTCINIKNFQENYFDKINEKTYNDAIINNMALDDTDKVLITKLGDKIVSSSVYSIKDLQYFKDNQSFINANSFKNAISINNFNLQEKVILSYFDNQNVHMRILNLFEVFSNHNAFLFGLNNKQNITDYLKSLINLDSISFINSFKFEDQNINNTTLNNILFQKDALSDQKTFWTEQDFYGIDLTLRINQDNLYDGTICLLECTKPLSINLKLDDSYNEDKILKLLNMFKEKSNITLKPTALNTKLIKFYKNALMFNLHTDLTLKSSVPFHIIKDGKILPTKAYEHLHEVSSQVLKMYASRYYETSQIIKDFIQLFNKPYAEALKELDSPDFKNKIQKFKDGIKQSNEKIGIDPDKKIVLQKAQTNKEPDDDIEDVLNEDLLKNIPDGTLKELIDEVVDELVDDKNDELSNDEKIKVQALGTLFKNKDLSSEFMRNIDYMNTHPIKTKAMALAFSMALEGLDKEGLEFILNLTDYDFYDDFISFIKTTTNKNDVWNYMDNKIAEIIRKDPQNPYVRGYSVLKTFKSGDVFIDRLSWLKDKQSSINVLENMTNDDRSYDEALKVISSLKLQDIKLQEVFSSITALANKIFEENNEDDDKENIEDVQPKKTRKLN